MSVGYLIGAIVFFHLVIIAAQKWLGPLETSAAVLSDEALRARDIALYGQAGKGDLDDAVLDVDDEVRPPAGRLASCRTCLVCMLRVDCSQKATKAAVLVWCLMSIDDASDPPPPRPLPWDDCMDGGLSTLVHWLHDSLQQCRSCSTVVSLSSPGRSNFSHCPYLSAHHTILQRLRIPTTHSLVKHGTSNPT